MQLQFVAVLDINEDAGLALVNDLTETYDKSRIQFMKCDVTKEEQLNKSFEQIIVDNSHIDVIVNSAAIANDAEYKKEIELNLVKSFYIFYLVDLFSFIFCLPITK